MDATRYAASGSPRIRRAAAGDLPDIAAIYNHEALHGLATLDLAAKSPDDFSRWLAAHQEERHPVFVAEMSGRVVGYAALSPFREKEGFMTTAELSVYVAAGSRRSGVASALMAAILDHARRRPELHALVAAITYGNAASVRLNERFGFRPCGVLREAARKFDKFVDVGLYELLL